MILKELDPFTGTDKYEVAGRRAEEQMAHYLKRFFGSHPEVDVINYLRITLAGEVAQMDHLVLHPFGLSIVESKSVAGSVQIKDDGQWIRWFNKQPQGMRSPVTQARMQALLLKELLVRTVKPQGFFDSVGIDVLVAISDTGTIQWPSSGALAEVCKADQVPERLLERLGRSTAPVLRAEHRRAIAEFLLKMHTPLVLRGSAALPSAHEPQPVLAKSSTAPSAPRLSVSHAADASTQSKTVSEIPTLTKACKHCQGADLQVQYGKYGYYFVCASCSKNTGIKFDCPACGAEGRIRKAGSDFYAECKSCDASSLFHTN